MDLSDARVAHALPGRVRIRIAARQRERAYFDDVARALAECDGVRDVRASALTGSVLVIHTTTLEAIAAFGAQRGLFALAPGAHEVALARERSWPIAKNAKNAKHDPLARSDTRARRLSASLASLGALQTVRGQVMAPALTLFWYAYDAWRSRPSTHRSDPPIAPSADRGATNAAREPPNAPHR
jgi:hypothetical protein